ncbi:unnamed protein product [Calypogeia fissa]
MSLMDCRTGSIMFFVILVWILTAGTNTNAQCPFLLTPSQVAPSSTSTFQVNSAELDSIVANFLNVTAQNGIPSYAVAVVYQNETIYTSGLSTTPFRCASQTKTFTALGALMLRERGLLSLDDPVNKFLSDFSVISPYGEHNTTIRELMAHVSGLPMQLCPFLQTCTDNETEILQQISGMALVRPPWSSQPVYSNLGIALLGHTWEKATSPQVTWWDFIRDNVVTPLRMTNTGIDLTDVVLADNTDPFALQDLGWSAPAAQMYTTAEDLAKFLAFVITGNPPLISDASRREWIRPTKLFSDGQSGYAMPWELYKLPNVTADFIISKFGNINSYLSHMAFHQGTQLGVVVLTVYNKAGIPGPDALANAILTALIPEVENSNNQTISQIYDGLYQCAPSPGFASPTLNYTVAVLGGTISVTSNDSLGLSATLSVTLRQTGGQPYVAAGGPLGLLLKNATENSFWFGDSSVCMWYYSGLSGGPNLRTPNTPDTFYTNEIIFDLATSSVSWPAVGANCTRS